MTELEKISYAKSFIDKLLIIYGELIDFLQIL